MKHNILIIIALVIILITIMYIHDYPAPIVRVTDIRPKKLAAMNYRKFHELFIQTGNVMQLRNKNNTVECFNKCYDLLTSAEAALNNCNTFELSLLVPGINQEIDTKLRIGLAGQKEFFKKAIPLITNKENVKLVLLSLEYNHYNILLYDYFKYFETKTKEVKLLEHLSR